MIKFAEDGTPDRPARISLWLTFAELDRLRHNKVRFAGAELGLGSGTFVIVHGEDPDRHWFEEQLGDRVCDVLILPEAACEALRAGAALEVELRCTRRGRPAVARVSARSSEPEIARPAPSLARNPLRQRVPRIRPALAISAACSGVAAVLLTNVLAREIQPPAPNGGAPHSGLEVEQRVDPKYPDAARALNLDKVRCLATVLIDEQGTPYSVSLDGCPDAFHENARDALLQWRWYPPTDGGNPVKARTTISITYKLD